MHSKVLRTVPSKVYEAWIILVRFLVSCIILQKTDGLKSLLNLISLPNIPNYPTVESPWTQWTLSMDIVRLEYWNKGPWTMFPESMDNVH